MITYRRNDHVLYYGEKCIVLDVFGATVFLQSIENPNTSYEVSVTSRFMDKYQGVQKYCQYKNLVVR